MSGFSRFFKKSLVLNPYITVTAVLSAVGVAIPTTYWFVGDTSERKSEQEHFISADNQSINHSFNQSIDKYWTMNTCAKTIHLRGPLSSFESFDTWSSRGMTILDWPILLFNLSPRLPTLLWYYSYSSILFMMSYHLCIYLCCSCCLLLCVLLWGVLFSCLSLDENSFSIVREMYRDPIKDFATNEQGKYLNPEIREQQRLLAVKKHAELRRQHAE